MNQNNVPVQVQAVPPDAPTQTHFQVAADTDADESNDELNNSIDFLYGSESTDEAQEGDLLANSSMADSNEADAPNLVHTDRQIDPNGIEHRAESTEIENVANPDTECDSNEIALDNSNNALDQIANDLDDDQDNGEALENLNDALDHNIANEFGDQEDNFEAVALDNSDHVLDQNDVVDVTSQILHSGAVENLDHVIIPPKNIQNEDTKMVNESANQRVGIESEDKAENQMSHPKEIDQIPDEMDDKAKDQNEDVENMEIDMQPSSQVLVETENVPEVIDEPMSNQLMEDDTDMESEKDEIEHGESTSNQDTEVQNDLNIFAEEESVVNSSDSPIETTANQNQNENEQEANSTQVDNEFGKSHEFVDKDVIFFSLFIIFTLIFAHF